MGVTAFSQTSLHPKTNRESRLTMPESQSFVHIGSFFIEMVASTSKAAMPTWPSSSSQSTTNTRSRHAVDYSHTIGRVECPDANELNSCADLEIFHLYEECKCIDLEHGQGVSFVCMQGDFLWCEGRSEHTANSAQQQDGESSVLGSTSSLRENGSSRGGKTKQNQILGMSASAIIGAALLIMVVRVVSRRQPIESQGYPTTPNPINTTYRDGNEEEQGRENHGMEDNEEGVSSSRNQQQQQQQPKPNSSQVELATFS